MPSIIELTRAKIIAYLEVFVEKLVEDNRDRVPLAIKDVEAYLAQSDSKGGLKPFHAALVPAEVLRISAFERSLVTRLGTTLEECAMLIAKDHHREAIRGYELKGSISTDAITEIERAVASFEHVASVAQPRQEFASIIEMVVNANTTGNSLSRDKKVDLYVLDNDGSEHYFEMKTAKPNKDQCLRITQGILQVHALRNLPRPHVKGYLALPYNPYGSSREDYKWTYTKNYMPYDDAVLIGNEFWTIIGGQTCYQELLEIYQYVGRVRGKFIIDSLAFGL